MEIKEYQRFGMIKKYFLDPDPYYIRIREEVWIGREKTEKECTGGEAGGFYVNYLSKEKTGSGSMSKFWIRIYDGTGMWARE
jgi:hypothetical protein